ncbi:MAG: hypothetical protein ACRDI2_05285, partial [Chloroflexota bacterium]
RTMIRHGDVLMVPAEAPVGEASVSQPGERLVLMEGEATGHAHVLEGLATAVRYRSRALVQVHEPAMLRHEEHKTVAVPPGWYEVVRQRVYAPTSRDLHRSVVD